MSLKIKNVAKKFNIGTENEVTVFRSFDLEIEQGKCTAVLGSNGCGKSTLFNLISGSLPIDDGEIWLDGQEISTQKEEKRAKKIGRVYQDPSMGVSPSLTILENMSIADKKGESFTLKSLLKKEKQPRYKELLKELDLGLENKLNTKVKFLSGGQRQSLSLVMATMKKPQLLLLDEHTAALDPKTSAVIMQKTQEFIQKDAITTLMISHNMRDALLYSDRIIMLEKGNVVLDKNSSDMTEEELVDIYREKLYTMAY